MTAGADAFASGLFTRFDLTVLVSEPTRRGVGVYRQYAEHAAELRRRAAGARQQGHRRRATAAYLREQVGDALHRVVRPVGVGAGRRARRRRGRWPSWSRRTSPCSTPSRAALDAQRARLGGLPPRHRRVPPAQRPRVGRPRRPASTSPPRSIPTSCPVRRARRPTRTRRAMSLDVPTAVLDAAERGELDDAAVRRRASATRCPTPGEVVSAVATRPAGKPFGEHEVPPPSEARARSAAARAGQQRHPRRPGAALRCGAGVPELPPGRRLPPRRRWTRRAYREFISPRGQILNQTPELRDC